MKKWKVKFSIEDFDLELYAYIEANVCLKTSHDSVTADGINISLPGNIESVEVI